MDVVCSYEGSSFKNVGYLQEQKNRSIEGRYREAHEDKVPLHKRSIRLVFMLADKSQLLHLSETKHKDVRAIKSESPDDTRFSNE